MELTRTSLNVTVSVWRALFLREAIQRLFNSRGAWVWLFLEPIVHVAFLMFLLTAVKMRVVEGIETPVWIMVGLLAFFMFKRVGTQGMAAIKSNKSLFTYRQVKPVDTVLARSVLEGFVMILVSIFLFAGAALFGIDVIPADPLGVIIAFIGLLLVGLGFGLIASVAGELVPELDNIISLIMTPLYFLSGVIFPLVRVPTEYREWLMLNPIAHGLEAARLGFAPYYQAVPEMSMAYLYSFAICTIFIGLALQVRFSLRLATK